MGGPELLNTTSRTRYIGSTITLGLQVQVAAPPVMRGGPSCLGQARSYQARVCGACARPASNGPPHCCPQCAMRTRCVGVTLWRADPAHVPIAEAGTWKVEGSRNP